VHGDCNVVLIPDGTKGYAQIAKTATLMTLPGTKILVPIASAETILHSKATADCAKDRTVLDRMREVLRTSGTTPNRQ
jgi:hypothetical protein